MSLVVTGLNHNTLHSTGCHVWPLTAGLFIFFSTLCICYRNQMVKNNTLKNVIYSFWLHRHCSVCPSSISFCNNSVLNVYVQTALFLAGCRYTCTTKISFSSFSRLICVPSCSSVIDTSVIESQPPSGTAKSKERKQTFFLTHHLIALQLCFMLKLAKWPWWGRHQLSIIDYWDFLHIHLRAPLSSLININQKVVRE